MRVGMLLNLRMIAQPVDGRAEIDGFSRSPRLPCFPSFVRYNYLIPTLGLISQIKMMLIYITLACIHRIGRCQGRREVAIDVVQRIYNKCPRLI